MTVEVNEFVQIQDPHSAEHSSFSKSKKITQGPLWVPAGDTSPDDERTKDPMQMATGGEFTLDKNKAYRLISDVDIYFRMSVNSDTAAVGDIYLPAKTALIVTSERFDFLSHIAVTAAGFVQMVEVR